MIKRFTQLRCIRPVIGIMAKRAFPLPVSFHTTWRPVTFMTGNIKMMQVLCTTPVYHCVADIALQWEMVSWSIFNVTIHTKSITTMTSQGRDTDQKGGDEKQKNTEDHCSIWTRNETVSSSSLAEKWPPLFCDQLFINEFGTPFFNIDFT